jgi:hypothetical protein
MVGGCVYYDACPVLSRNVRGYVEDIILEWGGVRKPCVNPSVCEHAILVIKTSKEQAVNRQVGARLSRRWRVIVKDVREVGDVDVAEPTISIWSVSLRREKAEQIRETSGPAIGCGGVYDDCVVVLSIFQGLNCEMVF